MIGERLDSRFPAWYEVHRKGGIVTSFSFVKFENTVEERAMEDIYDSVTKTSLQLIKRKSYTCSTLSSRVSAVTSL